MGTWLAQESLKRSPPCRLAMLGTHFAATVVPRVGRVIHETKGTGCDVKFCQILWVPGRKIQSNWQCSLLTWAVQPAVRIWVLQLQQLFCKVEDTSEGKIKEKLTLTGGAAEPNSAEAYLQASCFAGKRIPYLFKPLLTLVLVVPSVFPKDTVLKMLRYSLLHLKSVFYFALHRNICESFSWNPKRHKLELKLEFI